MTALTMNNGTTSSTVPPATIVDSTNSNGDRQSGSRMPPGLLRAVLVHSLLGQCYTFLLLSSNLLYPFMLDFTVTSFNRHYSTQLSETGISWLWSLTVTSYSIGSLCGALSMRTFFERFGRRDTIMIFAQVGTDSMH